MSELMAGVVTIREIGSAVIRYERGGASEHMAGVKFLREMASAMLGFRDGGRGNRESEHMAGLESINEMANVSLRHRSGVDRVRVRCSHTEGAEGRSSE